MEILDFVKTSLRIRTSDEAIDMQIETLINAAKLDLTSTANISGESFDDDNKQPLLFQAVALFVGFNFISDQATADKLKARYDDLKGKLAVSRDFTTED